MYGIRAKPAVGSMQELVLWADRNGLLDGYVQDGAESGRNDPRRMPELT